MPCAQVLLGRATLRMLEGMLSKGRPLTRGSMVLVLKAPQHLVLKEVSYIFFIF